MTLPWHEAQARHSLFKQCNRPTERDKNVTRYQHVTIMSDIAWLPVGVADRASPWHTMTYVFIAGFGMRLAV